MLNFTFFIKLIQLLVFFVLCLRFKPTLRWAVCAAIVPTLSLFTPGSYESGDFTTHIVRAMDLYTSLQHGIFPVRWAWLLQGGYGYPLFSFMTVLPYYVLALFHTAGLSFVAAMKLFLAIVYLGSATSMWLCARAVFSHHKNRELIATLSSVFYVYAPYTLINLEFRSAIGELAGFALIPLLLYALLERRRLLFCTALAALLLSHPGITLLGFPWIFVVLLIKRRWSFFFPIALAAGLAAFYLFPSLLEARFTQQVQYGNTPWTATTIPGFQPISWLFWSPWRFGLLWQGHFGEVANVLGVVQGLGVLGVVAMLAQRAISKTDQHICIALLGIGGIGLFMVLPFARPVWNMLPLIKQLQFPSRMMFYLVFSTALLAGFVFSRLSHRRMFWRVMLFLAIGWTVLNWSHRAFHPEVDDVYLFNRLPLVSFMYERLPEAMPVVGETINEPRKRAFVIEEGSTQGVALEQTPILRRYLVRGQTPAVFHEQTLFFPGWKATVNGKLTDIAVAANGTMRIPVPAGESAVTFRFADTPVRKASNAISAGSLVVFGMWGVRSALDLLRNKKRRQHLIKRIFRKKMV